MIEYNLLANTDPPADAKFVPLSLPVRSRQFNANHPFVFAIRTPETVLFIGHVVQPSQQ